MERLVITEDIRRTLETAGAIAEKELAITDGISKLKARCGRYGQYADAVVSLLDMAKDAVRRREDFISLSPFGEARKSYLSMAYEHIRTAESTINLLEVWA